MSLYTQEIKNEPVSLRSYRNLDSVLLLGDLFKASYQNIDEKENGESSVVKKQSVDRSIDQSKGDVVDFNGVQISLTDFIGIAVQFAEKWRIADDEAVNNPVKDGGGAVAIP